MKDLVRRWGHRLPAAYLISMFLWTGSGVAFAAPVPPADKLATIPAFGLNSADSQKLRNWALRTENLRRFQNLAGNQELMDALRPLAGGSPVPVQMTLLMLAVAAQEAPESGNGGSHAEIGGGLFEAGFSERASTWAGAGELLSQVQRVLADSRIRQALQNETQVGPGIVAKIEAWIEKALATSGVAKSFPVETRRSPGTSLSGDQKAALVEFIQTSAMSQPFHVRQFPEEHRRLLDEVARGKAANSPSPHAALIERLLRDESAESGGRRVRLQITLTNWPGTLGYIADFGQGASFWEGRPVYCFSYEDDGTIVLNVPMSFIKDACNPANLNPGLVMQAISHELDHWIGGTAGTGITHTEAILRESLWHQGGEWAEQVVPSHLMLYSLRDPGVRGDAKYWQYLLGLVENTKAVREGIEARNDLEEQARKQAALLADEVAKAALLNLIRRFDEVLDTNVHVAIDEGAPLVSSAVLKYFLLGLELEEDQERVARLLRDILVTEEVNETARKDAAHALFLTSSGWVYLITILTEDADRQVVSREQQIIRDVAGNNASQLDLVRFSPELMRLLSDQPHPQTEGLAIAEAVGQSGSLLERFSRISNEDAPSLDSVRAFCLDLVEALIEEPGAGFLDRQGSLDSSSIKYFFGRFAGALNWTLPEADEIRSAVATALVEIARMQDAENASAAAQAELYRVFGTIGENLDVKRLVVRELLGQATARQVLLGEIRNRNRDLNRYFTRDPRGLIDLRIQTAEYLADLEDWDVLETALMYKSADSSVVRRAIARVMSGHPEGYNRLVTLVNRSGITDPKLKAARQDAAIALSLCGNPPIDLLVGIFRSGDEDWGFRQALVRTVAAGDNNPLRQEILFSRATEEPDELEALRISAYPDLFQAGYCDLRSALRQVAFDRYSLSEVLREASASALQSLAEIVVREQDTNVEAVVAGLWVSGEENAPGLFDFIWHMSIADTNNDFPDLCRNTLMLSGLFRFMEVAHPQTALLLIEELHEKIMERPRLFQTLLNEDDFKDFLSGALAQPTNAARQRFQINLLQVCLPVHHVYPFPETVVAKMKTALQAFAASPNPQTRNWAEAELRRFEPRIDMRAWMRRILGIGRVAAEADLALPLEQSL
ncbi:MAG: hypothetical protein JW937_00840 [Candidatus Omnitrophica bacterium]|nr:hypothetical protein [Candidatus Omnitrophota bacterium]